MQQDVPFVRGGLSYQEAVATAKDLSYELCAATAVAYDSTRHESAYDAMQAEDLAVIVIADTEFGNPYRWGDMVFAGGKRR